MENIICIDPKLRLKIGLKRISAILQSIIKEKKSSDGIMVKLYELYPLLCNIITFCPENLMEPISHALLAYHPFLSKE